MDYRHTIKLILILLATCSINVYSADLDRNKGYLSEVETIIPGFWEHVGVRLANGDTCNGKQTIMLERSNVVFDQIYSLVLTAIVSDRAVHFGPRVGARLSPHGYCIFTEAALGQNSDWTTQ